ncbi:MAG: DMT family transporter [Ardenticatenales bacterium]
MRRFAPPSWSAWRGALGLPAFLVLPVAVAAISTSAVIIKTAGPAVGALALAMWRMVIAAGVAAAFALASRDARRQIGALDRRSWAAAVLAGLLLAAHFGLWVPSVQGTKVASSLALVTTSPLWVALVSPYLIGERIGWQLRGAVALGFGGAIVIMVGDALTFGHGHVLADGLALGGAIAVAGYFIVGRTLRPRLSLRAYVAVVYSAAAIVLLATAIVLRTPLVGWDGDHWLLVGAFALLPQLIGHGSLNWALARLTATYVAAATLLEPIGGTLLDWWLFDQIPSRSAWLGGGMVIAALGWATYAELNSARPRTVEAAANAL